MKHKPFIDIYSKQRPFTLEDFDIDRSFYEERYSVIDYVQAYTNKEAKEKSDMICDKLFELYKECKMATVYSINRKQFERFLKEMLPIWVKQEKKNERVSKNRNSI